MPEHLIKDDDREWLDFEEVKEKLASLIKEADTKLTSDSDVEVDDEFFIKAKYDILQKGRNEDERKWLVTEKKTEHKNLCSSTVTYTFQVSFDETSSTEVMLTKCRSFSFEGGVGGSFGGGNLGFMSGFQQSKSRGASMGQSRSDVKQMTVELKVPPNTTGIVKELVYQKEYKTECHAYLVLGERKHGMFETIKKSLKNTPIQSELNGKDSSSRKIAYYVNSTQKEIEVGELLNHLFPKKDKPPPYISEHGDIISFNMKFPCFFFTVSELKLETSYQ